MYQLRIIKIHAVFPNLSLGMKMSRIPYSPIDTEIVASISVERHPKLRKRFLFEHLKLDRVEQVQFAVNSDGDEIDP